MQTVYTVTIPSMSPSIPQHSTVSQYQYTLYSRYSLLLCAESSYFPSTNSTHLRRRENGSSVNSLLSIGDLHEPTRSKDSASIQVLVEVKMVASSLQLVQSSVRLPLLLDLPQWN